MNNTNLLSIHSLCLIKCIFEKNEITFTVLCLVLMWNWNITNSECRYASVGSLKPPKRYNGNAA